LNEVAVPKHYRYILFDLIQHFWQTNLLMGHWCRQSNSHEPLEYGRILWLIGSHIVNCWTDIRWLVAESA